MFHVEQFDMSFILMFPFTGVFVIIFLYRPFNFLDLMILLKY
ncbi:MAG: hypothetical protein JG782_892 [Anaerophaga sp.]|nr:hypothetical protein [Anaerophaga sp.]MDK2841170.1 hypothetical protein [Anaerophaga sp.]